MGPRGKRSKEQLREDMQPCGYKGSGAETYVILISLRIGAFSPRLTLTLFGRRIVAISR